MQPSVKSKVWPLLIVGPDSTVDNTFGVALQAYPGRRIEKLQVPVSDYYLFDLSNITRYDASKWKVCTSVNEFYLNDVRRAFHAEIAALGFMEESVVSPLAHVDGSTEIAAGAIVHAGCTIDANVKIGRKVLLRPNVVIGDATKIGDFVTIEANVSVREQATIGDHTLVSANASLARTTQVGKFCYLNQPKQYAGTIPDYTSISTLFQNPVRFYP